MLICFFSVLHLKNGKTLSRRLERESLQDDYTKVRLLKVLALENDAIVVEEALGDRHFKVKEIGSISYIYFAYSYKQLYLKYL